MKLEEAWLKIMEIENSERFKPNQLHSILSDFGVFKANPRIRLVLKSALYYNLWEMIVSPSISKNALSHLQSKLLNDGFSIDVINTLIESFYNDAPYNKSKTKEVSTYDKVQEVRINPSSEKDPRLEFMGIALGQSLEEFEIGLSKKRLIKQKRASKDCETYLSFKGSFAGLPDCVVEIYFCGEEKIVYKIEVVKTTTLSYGGYEEVFNRLKKLYSEKYGSYSPLCKNSNVGGINEEIVYTVFKDDRIEIATGRFWGNRVRYVSGNLYKRFLPHIEQLKRERDARIASIKKDKHDRAISEI